MIKMATGFELYDPKEPRPALLALDDEQPQTLELTEQEIEDYAHYSAYFLRNEHGDWYAQTRELQQIAQESGAEYLFAVIEADGLLKIVTTDPAGIFPSDGLQVLHGKRDEFPEDIENMINAYRWDGEKFVVDNKPYIDAARQIIEEELQWATARLGAFSDMLDLDYILSPAQEQFVKELKLYRIHLLEIDINKAPNIHIPDRPAL
nr:MAG TPA: tail fiber assembly protein [Caudoviricetes sp.]